MDVKILGTGCANCKRLEKVTHQALADLGVEATVTKVTDMMDILSYEILATPGLVLNGKVVSSGRVLTRAETASLIATALSEAES